MTYAITAAIREKDKSAKDELRQQKVPGVVYGQGITSTSISVGRSDLFRLLKQAGSSSLVDLTIGAESPVKVLIKAAQMNPVTNDIIHVDFHQIRMDQELETEVPLKFVGESLAVKSEGGTLIKSLDAIMVRCLPANLPHEIEIDLSKLATFDDAINVGSLTMPTGVTALTDGDVTIATVAAPMTEEQLKKLEEGEQVDLTAIKTEGEEKKAEEEAKKAEEAAAVEAAK
jgi:large subunit ribosomal protein L25